jgi:ABC-type Fe3+-hydroxamate transport system substrate-binding protein
MTFLNNVQMKNAVPILTLINPELILENTSKSVRIISLVPSQTELLHYLGLENEVVGITKFCIHPKEWHQSKIRVGGTKQYKTEVIDDLHPTIILGNKEENDKTQVLALSEKYPVWISDIKTLEDAYQMILEVGALFQKKEKAEALVKELKAAFGNLPVIGSLTKAAYFIWRKPFMVAGNGTFIHEMMKIAGFENVFGHQDRYPQTELSDLAKHQPEVILLSSEPYPFKEQHLEEFRIACPEAQVILVDGELFSWYGNRLLDSAAYFKKLKEIISVKK